MVSQVYVLLFTGLLAFNINLVLQYFVLKSKINKIEKEWSTIKSLMSLSSFRNYLNVVSADEAQDILEQLLVGLRTLPSIDLMTDQVIEKLGSLKHGLKALLDSLELIDSLNSKYFNIKKNYKMGSFMAYSSLIILFSSIALLFTSYFPIFYGVSAGLALNSLLLLLTTLTDISKIQKAKKKLKELLQWKLHFLRTFC